jgi:hypothetical protein
MNVSPTFIFSFRWVMSNFESCWSFSPSEYSATPMSKWSSYCSLIYLTRSLTYWNSLSVIYHFSLSLERFSRSVNILMQSTLYAFFNASSIFFFFISVQIRCMQVFRSYIVCVIFIISQVKRDKLSPTSQVTSIKTDSRSCIRFIPEEFSEESTM